MLENLCAIITLGIIVCIIVEIVGGVRRTIKADKTELENRKNNIDSLCEDIDNVISNFFNTEFGNYASTRSSLNNIIANMKKDNSDMISKYGKQEDKSSQILAAEEKMSEFSAFGNKVTQFSEIKMFDARNYGKIQKQYWDTVRSLKKNDVDEFVVDCKKRLDSKEFTKIYAIDIEMLLKAVWFYATEKMYSSTAFKNAVHIFNRIHEKAHVDIIIAEFYAMKQMGGEDVLKEHVRNMLKLAPYEENTNTPEKITRIASAFMWMNAYQSENILLQYMLANGMQMPAKTQERLHSLAKEGGKAPSGFDVESTSVNLYFDVSSLVWKDDEYIGLFENLAFQEKTLSYSLAVRDEDKDLFITNGINVPDMKKILTKLKTIFSEEYGLTVSAVCKDCIALSGSGEEKMKGILVTSSECKQMGILVHVVHIGKKLDIKFYTLFMPSGNNILEQKQQVLSLFKKLSPSVAMWESSLKDTVLMAVQQLLNDTPQSNYETKVNESIESDAPIF